MRGGLGFRLGAPPQRAASPRAAGPLHGRGGASSLRGGGRAPWPPCWAAPRLSRASGPAAGVVAAGLEDGRGRDARWEAKFKLLLVFKSEHGHCNVPTTGGEGEGGEEQRELGRWVSQQRRKQRGGSISPARAARLEKAGLVWDAREAAWEEHFFNLVDFVEGYGHFRVPQRKWKAQPGLYQWMQRQRKDRAGGRMSSAHEELLGELGFWDGVGGGGQEWDSGALLGSRSDREAQWERMFRRLQALSHGASGGHGLAAFHRLPPPVAKWASIQRAKRRLGRLAQRHVDRLEWIGFAWDAGEGDWVEMCELLEEYVEAVGFLHAWLVLCEVRGTELFVAEPTAGGGEQFVAAASWAPGGAEPRWATERRLLVGLKGWLARQEEAAGRGALPAQRRRRLEAAGFLLPEGEGDKDDTMLYSGK